MMPESVSYGVWFSSWSTEFDDLTTVKSPPLLTITVVAPEFSNGHIQTLAGGQDLHIL